MIRSVLLLILISILGSECSHKIASSTVKSTNESYSLNTIIEQVNKNSVQSKWIQAKAQVSIDGGGFFSRGSMNIRSLHDSLIWISVSKLGIEIGRGLIRADSAFITNDWESTYWQGSLREIGLKYNVPASLSDIQELIFPSLDTSAHYLGEQKSLLYELIRPGQPSKKYWISTIPELLIQNLSLNNGNTELKIRYEDYQKQDGYWFPFTHRHQFIQNSEIRETNIKFSQIIPSTSLSTPFHIPDDYTLIK